MPAHVGTIMRNGAVVAICMVLQTLTVRFALAQASLETTPQPFSFEAQDENDGPVVDDSGVGYIDNAIPGNQLRIRFDAAFDNVQPARGEFFWPVGDPFGPGPGAETSVDYQEFSLYFERLTRRNLSIFGELPLRMVNPEIQDNTGGLSDANVGFKYRFRVCPNEVVSFQLRTYVPSGDASRGLGNRHVSLEPALLWYRRFSERVALEAELRDSIPIGGTDGFAGNVLRYGVGANLRLNEYCSRPVSAVVEFVGWTVLSGRTAISTSPVTTTIRDAAGATIVNAKFGLRWALTPRGDMYIGYGRSLTGNTWYDDVVRVEWRTLF